MHPDDDVFAVLCSHVSGLKATSAIVVFSRTTGVTLGSLCVPHVPTRSERSRLLFGLHVIPPNH